MMIPLRLPAQPTYPPRPPLPPPPTHTRTQVGDKVVNISASFGSDVWEALNFGQVIYAIKTRNGQVYLRLKRNYGSTAALEEAEETAAERQYREERSGGNYGAGTKEMQVGG